MIIGRWSFGRSVGRLLLMLEFFLFSSFGFIGSLLEWLGGVVDVSFAVVVVVVIVATIDIVIALLVTVLLVVAIVVLIGAAAAAAVRGVCI